MILLLIQLSILSYAQILILRLLDNLTKILPPKNPEAKWISLIFLFFIQNQLAIIQVTHHLEQDNLLLEEVIFHLLLFLNTQLLLILLKHRIYSRNGQGFLFQNEILIQVYLKVRKLLWGIPYFQCPKSCKPQQNNQV